jgi:LysR family transcriptional regulator, low CO2-responsive transcriptional regulator
VNYEQLFAFVTFAEYRNFTHAAAHLHISQPALHVQIRKLGEAIGRPLYTRTGRELVLTAEGERLAAYGREIRERGDHVLAELRGERATGPTVLAAGQGAFLYLLGPAIRRYRDPLRVLVLPGPQTIEAVRSARAHVGVVAAEIPPANAAKLRAVGQHVILPASHRLAERRAITPRDLAGEAIIVAPAGSPHRTMIEQHLRGIEWTRAVEVTGWELMLQFARLGIGLAIVNDFCEPPRGMVAVRLAGAPSITYYVIAREHLHAEARALRSLLLE